MRHLRSVGSRPGINLVNATYSNMIPINIVCVVIFHQSNKAMKWQSSTSISRLTYIRRGTFAVCSTAFHAKLTPKLWIGSQIIASGGSSQVSVAKAATELTQVSVNGCIQTNSRNICNAQTRKAYAKKTELMRHTSSTRWAQK